MWLVLQLDRGKILIKSIGQMNKISTNNKQNIQMPF